VGYGANQIREQLGDGRRFGVQLVYSIETQPLGTWGAIRRAKRWIKKPDFLVLNGDSWFDVNLEELLVFHRAKDAAATLALLQVHQPTRYGSVRVDGQGKVLEFVEKGSEASGLVNAGVYAFRREVFGLVSPTTRSLEQEVFPALAGKGLYGFRGEGFFVDIGIPEDYKKLRRDPRLWLRALGCGDRA
jgi:NDP-sugar pyrophosphorylase family protein